MAHRENEIERDCKRDPTMDYILSRLRRTNSKPLENYCITRILHTLDRWDVQFVTQQMFQRPDGSIALADLYFPQLDLVVEIDEGYHLGEEVVRRDAARTGDVIGAPDPGLRLPLTPDEVRYRLERLDEIAVSSRAIKRITAHVGIALVDAAIGDLVNQIKSEVGQLGPNFAPWSPIDVPPDEFVKRGTLRVADRPAFRTIQAVSELFNKGYRATQRGYFPALSSRTDMFVWCPILTLAGYSHAPKYFNTIDATGRTILESRAADNDSFVAEAIDAWAQGKDVERVVFAKFRDESGQARYRFRGVFRADDDTTVAERKRVWRWVSDTHDLGQYFS